jgi:hypothetical protein
VRNRKPRLLTALFIATAVVAVTLSQLSAEAFFQYLRAAWVLYGAMALVYTFRKWTRARLQHHRRRPRHPEENGAILYDLHWQLRAARLSVAIAACIAAPAALSVIDAIYPGPSLFGGAILLLLTGIPALFTYKQIDDDDSHAQLLRMIESPEGSPKRRSYDR